MPTDRLSPSDLRLLFRLVAWQQTHRYPPTIRDLCETKPLHRFAAGVPTNWVRLQLEKLRAAGLVTWEPKISRSIQLTCKVEIFRNPAKTGDRN